MGSLDSVPASALAAPLFVKGFEQLVRFFDKRSDAIARGVFGPFL